MISPELVKALVIASCFVLAVMLIVFRDSAGVKRTLNSLAISILAGMIFYGLKEGFSYLSLFGIFILFFIIILENRK